MSEENIFSDYLREIRAETKSKSLEKMTERLIAEKKLRQILIALKNEDFVIQEIMDESAGFDFIVRKFTDEILITLNYTNQHSLKRRELINFNHVLKYNSTSIGIIITWIMQEGNPSTYLSALELNKLLRQKSEVFDFQEVEPLKECIRSVFKKPLNVITDLTIQKKREVDEDRAALIQIFNKLLYDNFSSLKAKKFKLSYKKKALELLSTKDLKLIEEFSKLAIDQKYPPNLLEDYLKRITAVEE